MATRTQVNTLAGRAARRLCSTYWHTNNLRSVTTLIRVMVSEAKIIGTPQARRTLMAFLREVYIDIFGEDPVSKREFIHWLRRSLQPAQPDNLHIKGDPIKNVSLDDSFDANAEDIT